MEWHPYAKLFPMLPEDELNKLADDIRDNGLQHPIIVDADDRIIDGRNRFRACDMAGVQPRFDARDLNDKEALSLVVSENLRRRHLNESQRADIAAKMATLKPGGQRGNKNADKNEAANRPIRSDPVVSQQEAAALMNVSERSVRRAAKVHAKGTEELKDAVARGDVTVNRGEQIAELPQSEQSEAIKQNPREINTAKPETNGTALKPSKAILLADEAVNCLKKIPRNDPQWKRGFQIVSDFIKQTMRKR